MFEKSKRIVDKKLLASVRLLPCLVCRANPPSEADHIITRGAGGGDVDWNVWPQCVGHHHERHKIGIKTFALKYERAGEWIRNDPRLSGILEDA